MGCGIAAVSALAGNKTRIVSISKAHNGGSVQKAAAIISFLMENGLATKENANSAIGLLENGNYGYAAGRGFYDWSKKNMEVLQKERDEFLIAECRRRRNKKWNTFINNLHL